MKEGESVVTILWHATPFRGDKFEDAWRPVAEAAVDFGATGWGLFRSKDDPNDFMQFAVFPSREQFDRYWYSEDVAEARAEAAGLFEVPVTPLWHRVVDAGEVEPADVDA